MALPDSVCVCSYFSSREKHDDEGDNGDGDAKGRKGQEEEMQQQKHRCFQLSKDFRGGGDRIGKNTQEKVKNRRKISNPSY